MLYHDNMLSMNAQIILHNRYRHVHSFSLSNLPIQHVQDVQRHLVQPSPEPETFNNEESCLSLSDFLTFSRECRYEISRYEIPRKFVSHHGKFLEILQYPEKLLQISRNFVSQNISYPPYWGAKLSFMLDNFKRCSYRKHFENYYTNLNVYMFKCCSKGAGWNEGFNIVLLKG
jgi:hypothetical protein